VIDQGTTAPERRIPQAIWKRAAAIRIPGAPGRVSAGVGRTGQARSRAASPGSRRV